MRTWLFGIIFVLLFVGVDPAQQQMYTELNNPIVEVEIE